MGRRGRTGIARRAHSQQRHDGGEFGCIDKAESGEAESRAEHLSKQEIKSSRVKVRPRTRVVGILSSWREVRGQCLEGVRAA